MDVSVSESRSARTHSFAWSDRYRIGVPAIDADHQLLFELVGTFLDFPDPVPAEIVNLLLGALVDYAVVHFEREEEYQERIGYPGLAVHREQHAAFVRQVSALRMAHAVAPRQVDVPALRRLLHDWLIDHVMQSDVKIAQFENGQAR